MATESVGQRYRSCYALLLRMYRRPFHERFAQEMGQTFHDLCRERSGARSLSGLALWVFFETSMAIVKENAGYMSQWGKTVLRVALGALACLMAPLIASQVVEGWNWKPTAFVFVYVLFFGTGLAYAAIARRMGAWEYKAGVGLALLAGFALGWSNMVHVADSENPANLTYYSVLAVGVIGALLARLKARGLALTLFAMAATLGIIAAVLPSGAPPYMARNMAIGHVVQVVLFTVSGLLFRRASLDSGHRI